MPQIRDFIYRLKQANPGQHCVNPYQNGCAANDVRCHNLKLYLGKLSKRQPTHLLIGEAPGYRGCRLSGIPFVSPAILTRGLPACDLFGLAQGFVLPEDATAVTNEASATIMWQTIAAIKPTPLLWNAFPFHPHKPGHPDSNRSPGQAELAEGIAFLEQIIDMFQQPQLVAIGKKAAQLLSRCQWPHTAVRHPSHGGKDQFIKGIQALF